jgi:hypothetical protein
LIFIKIQDHTRFQVNIVVRMSRTYRIELIKSEI